MTFSVRPARSDDIESIADWTQDTFVWGDYVAGALEDWLADSEIEVFVATQSDDVPRAVSKVQMLSPTEGWLAAARVHPDWRRQGLGSLLNSASVEWIRRQGGLVGRLAVESDNSAAINQVKKLGYRATSAWVFGGLEPDTPVRIEKADLLSRVGRSDVDPAWMYWSTSELSEKGRGLFATGWNWRRTTIEDIEKAAGESRLFGNAAGWVMIADESEQLDVSWIAASQEDFPRLISGLRHLARERGLDTVYFRIPATGWSEETLAREGTDSFQLQVYAKAVDA